MAIVTSDFITDDECSCGILIKKGTHVFIKDTESDGTCYVEYNDFGFSINRNNLTTIS